MGLNVKSLYKDNSNNTNNSTKKGGLNVKSLRDQVFEFKLSDDKTISNISYGAKRAIENNTLDSYTPKNQEEKKALDDFKAYIAKTTQAQETAKKQEIIDSNPVFKKYNIEPTSFSIEDLNKWAKEHNYEIKYNSAGSYYAPKYEGGFLGIGGKKLTTDQEDEDLKTLTLIAQNNNRRELGQTDAGATVTAASSFLDGVSFGGASKLLDWSIKSEYEKAGLDADSFVSGSQALAKTKSEHPIAETVGSISGASISFGAAENILSKGLMNIPKYANLANSAAKGVKVAQKAKQLLDTTATIGTVTALSSSLQQDWKNDSWYNAVGNVVLDTTVSTVGAYLGGKLSGIIGENFTHFLKNKTKLSIPAIKALSSSAGAISFAGTITGATEIKNVIYSASKGLEYKPDVNAIVRDLTVLAIYSGLKSYVKEAWGTSTAPQKSEEPFKYFTEEDMKSPDALKKKWRQLSKQYHPDLQQNKGADAVAEANKIFAEINSEYDRAKMKCATSILSDLEKSQSKKTNTKNSESSKATDDAVDKAIQVLNDAYSTESDNLAPYSVVANAEKTPVASETVAPQTKAQTGKPSVQIGDVFKNNHTGVTYTIVDRGENETTVMNNQKNVTNTMSNTTADIVFNNPDGSDVTFTKVRSGDIGQKFNNTVGTGIATNTENALQNQSESATMESKTSTETEVNAKNATTTTETLTEKNSTVAYTNDNEKIDMKFKVVSVDDLIASNEIDGRINPNYPQELQPRDRSRVSSQNQIRQIANDLNPKRLAESTNVSEGAPIVGPDNVVESGNGRTLGVKLAYQLGTADGYKNFIINNANEYGIDVSNLPEKPVLVRERLTEVDRIEFTRKANESSISSLSATEQAKVDADNLTQDVLNLLVANDDGVINSSDNQNFISAVINKVFKNEDLNNVVGAEGRLSARGLERITNAIFYKAYGDASLSARLSESLDNDMKNATKVLLNIAPKVVYIKNGIASGHTYGFDFSGDIASAVRLFEKCRNENDTIEDYAMQMSFLEKESQLVMRMAYVFETKNRGAKQATDFYNLLLDTVDELGDPDQMSLDVFEVFQTKEEIFDAAVERFNNGNESKNTITIPESLSGPDSEEGRNDDERGKYEVVGDNTSRSETSGNPVGVQQNNGPGEETGVTADDEQLRPKKESVVGKSEVIKAEQKERVDNVDFGEHDSFGETQLRETKEEGLHRRGNQENIDGHQKNSSSGYEEISSSDEKKYDGRTFDEKSIIKNVFHGTPYQFSTFLKSYVDLGLHFGTEEQAKARLSHKQGGIINCDLILKNPLATEDIFGERTPKQYVDELINKSSLTQDEKLTLKREFDTYSNGDFSTEITESLKEKLSTGKYKVNGRVDEGGIFVSLMLLDDGLKVYEIPLAEYLDRNKLVEIIGLDETVKLIKSGSIDGPVEDVLYPYFVEAVLPFEKQFLQLRKIEEILQSFGYDGFAYKNENEGDGWSYAVFDDSQIIRSSDNVVSKDKGTQAIAKFVASKLKNGKNISAMELQKVANVAFGGTMADNAYSIKDAYDAMELGVNQHILSMKEVSADKMLELLELLPTQTKRTEEMVKFQQFSTPPSIAYLANYTANVNANDIMLEPSAGIGGIAVFAKKDGAKVYVNELDNRRLDVLKNMPFDGFFNEDAEQINNILGGKIEPTVIVMNPPFSSSSERNIQNTKIGAKHIEQALKILAPNGRLVAIVGNGMADGTPAFRNWWKDIKSQYNVRANIGINGKNYNKYGTNFDIQMLVIDKNGPTTAETVTGHVDTLQELQDKLGGIRDARPTIDYSANEQRTPTTTRKETVTKGKTTDNGDSTVSDTSSRTDKGKPEDAPRTSGKSNTQSIQSTDAERGQSSIVTTENTDAVADENGRLGSRESDGLVGEENSTRTDDGDSGQSDVSTRRTEPRKRVKKKELTDSIFEQYQPQSLRVKNAQPHPAKVSESAAMSAIEPPVITYKPNIPQDIIDKGVVSDVQLEAISYAGQSHSQTLPNGTTRGFFLGDGTGIGKGRTIAGMMLDNYNQGRKKAVWVTLNSSLVNDAKRDVQALFGNSDLVTQFIGGNKADSVLNTDEAIMVISYSALSKGFENKDSNFEKIVKWLGKDFDGLIVFDEAHKMGNATSTKGTRGIKKASQTGIAGISLQEALPKAKIVYSSATGATEVENLRYAERLGLWGEGTPFIKGDDFVSKVKAGGLAAMELIARDMKAMGVYLSRNISYDDVQYDKITHNLTPQQTKIYDELASSWQIVLQNINKALESTNQDKDGHARGRALGAFWSSQQRFFNQILTSMQVPSVISDIEKQLADGKSCVIQLVSTNEAAQNQEFERLKSEDLELDEFDLTPKQVLMSLVENSFPVQQFEEYVDDNGNKRSKPIVDSQGKPVLNREAVQQREELLTKLGSIKVPSSPIDMIINHFGTDLVAENTGRARRVIQKDGKSIEEKIGSKKDADVDAFQNGKKRIIIFSKAGGTGKSYHADRSAKNQQQRVHYLLEAGWQADNAVQGFGRSHRSNQAIAPIFKLVTTNLKGQMRFISTIAKRLDQLGAMTKGQRQAGSQGMFSASDNLENSFAADVLAGFYKDLVSNRVDGIDDGIAMLEKLGIKNKILNEYNQIIPTAPELREVNKFLNRILSLECSEQNTIFEGYSERLQDATEKAMQAGTLDKGLENYKADKITLNEVQDIREDEKSGAKTKYYNLTAEHKIKPVKFEDIPTNSKSFVGYYKNKNTGNVRAVMHTSSSTDQHGNVTQNFKLIGQIKPEYIPQHRLYGNWVEIKEDDARKAWNEELSKLPEFRKENLHLISGVVLPVWDKLPTENVRIYRVLTSDGEMLIGRVVSEDMIDSTLRQLGSSRKKEKIATKDLIEGIKNGDKVYLENDWKIFQSRVANEKRIEISGPSYEHHDMLMEKGVFAERIAYRTRYFIPANTNAEKVIDDILKLSPVMRVENEITSDGVHYSKQNADNTSDTEKRWTTERVERGNDKKKGKDSLVSTADIVSAIREKFGIPVATGKVTSRGASAQYNERAESIRTRIANHLPDISHELGHHLDKKYGLSDFESVDEVQKVVPQEFLDQYPEEEWKAESVSWFIEKYLQNTNNANRLAPDFFTDFVSALSKEDLKAVNEIANSVNEYMSSDIDERYGASITTSKEIAKENALIQEKLHELRQKWIDPYLHIKDAVDYVEEAKGQTLTGKGNAYILAINSLNSHSASNFLLTEGFRDLNGNIVDGAKSFLECISMVGSKDMKLLDEYLVLRHSLEWIAPEQEDVTKKRVFADDTLEDVEKIEKRIAKIEKEHPEFKTAAENLYEYQNNILKHYLVQTGAITEETIDTLNRKYPSYVPFYRAVGKDKSLSGKAKSTFVNQKSPIKRAKGSGELIISPLESIIKNTEKFVKIAVRNQVADVLGQYADTVDGFGKFMEPVAPDMVPHSINITKIKEVFLDELTHISKSSDDYFAVSDLFDQIFGDTVTDYSPTTNDNKKIVNVLRNGGYVYYQVHDDNLYKSVAELSPKQLDGLKAVDVVMNTMKLLITQNNPIFAATNLVRDFGTAYKLSPTNNPVEFTVGYLKALAGIIANSNEYKQYKAMGGGHSSELTANIENISKTLRKVAQKDMGKARRLAYAIFLHPVETAAMLNDKTESIARFAEFMRTLEAGGDLQQAIYNANDLTTNFRKQGAGTTAKVVNKFFLFNNAAIQGIDKTARTLGNKNVKQRNKTWMKFLVNALIMGILGYLYNKEVDEEGYENLSSYKKNNFYNFAIGDGKFISLPKPRENAILDSTVERAIEYMFGNDEAFYDFGSYLSSQLIPPMIPDNFDSMEGIAHSWLGSTALGGLVDIGFNRNFIGIPIEGEYEKYNPSNERYNENTTKFAYELGQTKLARELNLSPKKIDHLISSYTGIIGQVNSALFPMNEERRDTSIGLKNKFLSDSNYSTDLLNKAYDNKDKAELQWQYDNNINNAIEYEQNAVITSYISGMNKAIKALSEDEQREGRKYLLKALNNWNYELTTQQSNMQNKFENESIGKDYIFEELPSSEISWSYDKQKYAYQMTPQEYNKYISDYLKVIENARKKYGGNSLESYATAKQEAKDYMSEQYIGPLKEQLRKNGKATKVTK